MIVTGCGGSGEEPPLGQVPTIESSVDVGRLTLPLDPFSDSLALVDLVGRATDHLVQNCMQGYGLSWPRYLQAVDPTRPEHLRRWGINDPAEAVQYGYLPAEVIARRGQPEPPAPSPVTPDADAVAVGRVSEFHGITVPPGGCFGEANRQLSPGKAATVMGDVGLGRRLANEAYEHSLDDSRIKALFKRWSTCMHDAGYRYQRPFDASGDPAWSELDTEQRPTDQEISTATADIECRLQINLVGTWYAVEAAYQTKALNRHRSELEEEAMAIRSLERRARDVLADGVVAKSPGG